MIINKKNSFKPLYKQFLRLRENVQNRQKILKFKSKKWEYFIINYKRKLKRYKKFKPIDQNRFIVSKYPNKWNSYKNRYKRTLINSKKFRLLYGNINKKVLKKQINSFLNEKNLKKIPEKNTAIFLELFERRLETVLYKSKFCISLRNARQIITHKKVFVNSNLVKSPSYLLKPGDIINVDSKYYHLIEKNLKNTQIWPIPPKHILINYKTMTIGFIGSIKHTNLSTNFQFHLNLEKLLTNYLKH